MLTQNIDDLELRAGVPRERMVQMHGTAGEIFCYVCDEPQSLDWFRERVQTDIKDVFGTGGPAVSSPIACPHCGDTFLRPRVVLFGERLPRAYLDVADQLESETDLLIVAGTSLLVSPASGFMLRVPHDCPRVLVNEKLVGQDVGFLKRPNDVFLPGACDATFSALAAELGWSL